MQLLLKTMWQSTNELIPIIVGNEFINIKKFLDGINSGFISFDNLSTSSLNVLSFFSTAITTQTGNYTATIYDQIILADSTSAILTITLPTAIGISGRRYTIKDWKGKSATNNITIATTSSQTIDGVTTKVLSQNYVSYTVVSDGANWV